MLRCAQHDDEAECKESHGFQADRGGDRLVLIGKNNGRNAFSAVERRYARWEIARCETFLSGIAELAKRGARAVLAQMNGGGPRVGRAIAGLRAAGGKDVRIVLCCPAELEPAARAGLQHGADDYLLEPLDEKELDAALGVAANGGFAAGSTLAGTAVSMEEFAALGDILGQVASAPRELMARLAELVRIAMGSRGVSLVVEGAMIASGEAVQRPVLTASISGTKRIIGQVFLGESARGPYTFADAEKLERYAGVIGRVLGLSSRQRELERLAYTDECSGLPNRRFLRQRLQAILQRAEAERFPVTVLLFDVDNFKSFNDRFGHDAGDEIIRATGQLFRRSCREQDIVARYGGDEFCVVFWDASGPRVAGSRNLEEALVVLDRFQGALRAHRFEAMREEHQISDFKSDIRSQIADIGSQKEDGARQEKVKGANVVGHGTRASNELDSCGERGGLPGLSAGSITISGGLATFPWDGSTMDALLAKADAALLTAKRAGKNRIMTV